MYMQKEVGATMRPSYLHFCLLPFHLSIAPVLYILAMTNVPDLLEEPKLQLPDGPNLPPWDDFKPELV